MRAKFYIALFFLLLIVLFALQNSEMTEVVFLFWELRLSRVLVILGSAGIGLLAGILLTLKKQFQ